MYNYFLRRLPYIIFIWIALAIPVGISPTPDTFYFPIGLWVGLSEAFFPAVVLVALAGIPEYFLKKRGRGISTVFCLSLSFVTWIACFLELAIGKFTECRFNVASLRLILQTNANEATEFVNHAIDSGNIVPLFAISSVPLVLAILTIIVLRVAGPKFRRIIFLIAALGVLASAGFFIYRQQPLWKGTDDIRYERLLTPAQFVMAWSALDDNSAHIRRLIEANENVNVHRDGDGVPLLVIIIGESANKAHSSLYGYALSTNPRLQNIIEQNNTEGAGRLVLFDDAVTGDFTTMEVVKHVLTAGHDSIPWSNKPLLPAVLRKAGYNVEYYDNQCLPTTCEFTDYHVLFFLNDSTTIRQSFDYRNDTLYAYDGEFIARYIPRALSAPSPTACFFHLLGQHMGAQSRYPTGSARFTIDDYAQRTDLSSNARNNMMHYDNATVYNDSVLAKIINSVRDRDAAVIYFSDHGEEVYDYRDFYGRSDGPLSQQRVKALFEVPYWVYLTPDFVCRRPDIVANLEANRHSPVHTYRIADLVLDLAGVEGSMTDRRHSPASPCYDSTHPRRIEHATCDYDSLMRK